MSDQTEVCAPNFASGAQPVQSRPDPTDAARELAEDEGLDLADVDGTGRDGRVTKADVQHALSDEG